MSKKGEIRYSGEVEGFSGVSPLLSLDLGCLSALCLPLPHPRSVVRFMRVVMGDPKGGSSTGRLADKQLLR